MRRKIRKLLVDFIVSRPAIVESILKDIGVRNVELEVENLYLKVGVKGGSITRSFLGGKYFEKQLLDQFIEIGTKASYFINVGANIGSTLRYVQKNASYQRFTGFEPSTANFDILKSNCNGREMRLLNSAVGNYEGTVQLNLNESSNGRNSIKTSFGNVCEEVPITMLDSVIDLDDYFDLFIDVEGAELDVIEGCSARLSQCEKLCIEWNPKFYTNDQINRCLQLLKSSGFQSCLVPELGLEIKLEKVISIRDNIDVIFHRVSQ